MAVIVKYCDPVGNSYWLLEAGMVPFQVVPSVEVRDSSWGVGVPFWRARKLATTTSLELRPLVVAVMVRELVSWPELSTVLLVEPLALTTVGGDEVEKPGGVLPGALGWLGTLRALCSVTWWFPAWSVQLTTTARLFWVSVASAHTVYRSTL